MYQDACTAKTKQYWGVATLAVFLFLGGCAPQTSDPSVSQYPQVQAESPSILGDSDEDRLAELQTKRRADAFAPSFALGPGDVLIISEPDLKELNQVEVHVSAEDTLTLPLVGVIKVSGMTEDQLRAAIQKRLAAYVKDPQIDILVKEYHSREVAVLGMVRQPGLYTLASRADTLQDMLGRAGGATQEASSRILFIPAGSASNLSDLKKISSGTLDESNTARSAGSSGNATDQKSSAIRPAAQAEAAEAASLPRDNAQTTSGIAESKLAAADPIVIDLTRQRGAADLALPARPGDLLIVPAAGQVMVDGWVKTPGAYQISNGMTTLGAVSAAGGAMFSSTVVLLRTNPDKTKTAYHLDFSRVKSGAEPDVPVQAGDVVFVQRSVVGAVPYSLYTLFQKFGTGVMVPF